MKISVLTNQRSIVTQIHLKSAHIVCTGQCRRKQIRGGAAMDVAIGGCGLANAIAWFT